MRNRSGSPRKQSKQKTPEPVAVRVRLSALSTAISVTPSTTVKKSRSQPNSIDLPRHLLHLRREAMSNAMTAAHEPTIHYLDSVLSEEEKRCDYGHQWRNISISRSGRFRSKNKKRDAVDGKLFDAGSGSPKENEKVSFRSSTSGYSKTAATVTTGSMTTTGTQGQSQRAQVESYKSFYETNL
ncbi:uncharacterized protein [Drosophila takahashii]|uniref:uncharacterized protein isoform X3 n=1 Tax=Drosophila takahashii TaxID=29030 RepID=UPI0007E7254C|nr:uncharacterized protein LOC108054448 isoform X2 [Drosophila takahashii]